MVNEIIWRFLSEKISFNRSHSSGTSDRALIASAREPSTFLSVEPSAFNVTAKTRLSYGLYILSTTSKSNVSTQVIPFFISPEEISVSAIPPIKIRKIFPAPKCTHTGFFFVSSATFSIS